MTPSRRKRVHGRRGGKKGTGGMNRGCDLREVHGRVRGRAGDGRLPSGWVYKVEGRDHRLVYQPWDSRRLSRVLWDEFIGFIIKHGSQ